MSITPAQALLRHNPRLGEDYLAGLVADLTARLDRIVTAIKGDGASDAVVAEVRDFFLERPFQAARPAGGLEHFRWRRDWEVLVERIGTPKMRAAVVSAQEKDAQHRADFRAAASPEFLERISKPTTPVATPAPSAARFDRTMRDVVRARRIMKAGDAPAAEIAAYTDAALEPRHRDVGARHPEMVQHVRRKPTKEEAIAAKIERRAVQADAFADAMRRPDEPRQPFTDPDHPLFGLDDDLDDAMIAADVDREWTPAKVLMRVMRPATNALTRHRRSERALAKASNPREARRAAEELVRVERDPAVVAVRKADLAAERDMLRPVIQAALDGKSPRWRHIAGRIVDEKGRDLMPPCLRPWQEL